MARRQFQWEGPATVYRFYTLVCVTDPGPCVDNPCGRQIVAMIQLRRERFGRQKYCWHVRAWWDRGEDGRGHFQPTEHRIEYPNSWAIVGNVTRAKRWAEEWLDHKVYEWDDCEVTS